MISSKTTVGLCCCCQLRCRNLNHCQFAYSLASSLNGSISPGRPSSNVGFWERTGSCSLYLFAISSASENTFCISTRQVILRIDIYRREIHQTRGGVFQYIARLECNSVSHLSVGKKQTRCTLEFCYAVDQVNFQYQKKGCTQCRELPLCAGSGERCQWQALPSPVQCEKTATRTQDLPVTGGKALPLAPGVPFIVEK